MKDEQFEFEYDLDQILSEFTDSISPKEAPPAAEFSRREVPSDETRIHPAPSGRREQTTVFTPEQDRPAAPSRRRPVSQNKPSSPPRNDVPVKQRAPKKEQERLRPAQKKEKRQRKTFADVMPRWLVSFTGLLLTLVLLLFVLCCVTPASGSAAAVRPVPKTIDLSAGVNRFATEKAKEAALAAASRHTEELPELQVQEEMPVQKTVFRIPEESLVAPSPLVSGFGRISTDNAQEVLNVIQQARSSGLLGEDESVVFSPDVQFNTGSYYQDIQYYLDDTLLVVCWKEIIDGNTCTFCEVKMQDGSQLRRKLAGDMFGSDMLEYTTSMHKATNAVVSMNADFYRFRDMGIIVYNRQLYRFNEGEYLMRYGQMLKKYNCIDTMFVTSSGDFLFHHLYEESTPEEMQQFIADNDIVFSIAFGPVLVENGELNTSYFDEEWYPIGEINTGYSRAGIGQVDRLHYLYMSLNHSDEKAARWHTKEFAQHFYEKGVVNAYSLDGGQTSEIVFQGDEAYNHVDHVNGTSSRQVSDMIYFASAVNGEEVVK